MTDISRLYKNPKLQDTLKELDEHELYVLACYTLFNTQGTKSASSINALRQLLDKSVDIKKTLTRLNRLNLFVTTDYNWRNDTYDYAINDSYIISVMAYLYTEQKDIVSRLLDKVNNLSPTPLQKLLWSYIINDGNVSPELYNKVEVDDYIDVFSEIIAEPFFLELLQNFSLDNLYDLSEAFLVDVIEQHRMIDTAQIRMLMTQGKKRSATVIAKQERMICLCDLYDFLAYGKVPSQLYANNKNHCIIAAIHETYRGNLKQAYDHFKNAVKLNNKSTNTYYYYTSNLSYLPLDITNYFMVLTSFLYNSDESLKKCHTINKVSDREYTRSAKRLYGVILSGKENNELIRTFNNDIDSTHITENLIIRLLLHYIGSCIPESLVSITPDWLILKHEMRAYIPLSKEDEEACDKTFGPKPLLSNIYRKKEWENVLEELMGRSSANTNKSRSVRYTYVLRDINSNYVKLRQQTILKNGKWGAGKELSITTFCNEGYPEMSRADHRIANRIRKTHTYSSYDANIYDVLAEYDDSVILQVGQYAPFTDIEVTEETPYLTMARTKDGFDILSNVPATSVNQGIIITHRGAASINFIRLTEGQKTYYSRLLTLGHFPLEAEDTLREFLKGLGEKVFEDGSRMEVNSDLIEGGSTLQTIDGNPSLIMQMRPEDRESYAVSLFCRPLEGGKIRCTPGDGNEIIVDANTTDRYRIKRNLKKERENLDHFINSLVETGVDEVAMLTGGTMTIVPAFDLLPIIEYAQQNTDHITCEWPEGSEMRIKTKASSSSWNGSIKKNENGWFEIEGSIELDQEKVISMAQLMDLIGQSRGRFIKLGDGEFLALSDKLHKQLNQLYAVASRSHGKLQMSPFSAALIGNDMLQGELILEEDEELKAIRKNIAQSSKYKPAVPATLNATLRNYQQTGYQWMARLNKWGAGALLADDMGLGKTIQTITLLLANADKGPSLVLAPASVAPNWKTEFEKFAPSLNIHMLNFAEDRKETIGNAKAGDVVVSTYGLLLSVKDDIIAKQWTTICLDEAHIVKNRGAKTSAVAMQLKSDNRIMLTGTPVQNHLGELWNLFQFVNPGLLGSFEDFNRRFIIPIEQNKDKNAQKLLDRLVKPFMLRRTKEKVAKELPEKEEIYQHVECTEEEQLIYEALRQKAEALLLAEGSNKVSMNTLAEITRLRQCACDIRLIEEGRKGGLDKNGSKINALVELLSTIVEGEGHALVFSQFTSYLSLIKQALDKEKIPYLYIDGSVNIKQRTKLVNEFQEGKTPVFLISLKAGGLGLNLTRANYVIHMDPWWNPAIEAQATDRAHRIGQKNAVTVYHLIAEGTIEEKIQRLHERKQALVENILDSTDMSHKLTGQELLEMVSGV